MKKVYINENKLSLLNENNDKEVTFYEFFINTKNFLKDLLKNPNDADVGDILKDKNIDKNGLISKMKDIGLLKTSEKISEVESDKTKNGLIAKRYIKYSIPKKRFNERMHELYNDIFKDSSATTLDEDGGATSCGSVMQGGGTNPDAGQFTVPFSSIQHRGFWRPAMKRNKDEDNSSISMNRKK